MAALPLSLDPLRRATREGQAFDFLAFYGHAAGEPGALTRSCLSQWWRSSFVVDGVEYLTAEQFMMAGKARLFGDGAAMERILAEPNPAKVKRLGRGVLGFDEAVWAAHRFELVSFGSQEKFRQAAALRSFLSSTGEAILVEASPTDEVWGIGADGSSPVVNRPEAWRGLNLLGFALTRARGVLAGQLPEVPRGPWL